MHWLDLDHLIRRVGAWSWIHLGALVLIPVAVVAGCSATTEADQDQATTSSFTQYLESDYEQDLQEAIRQVDVAVAECMRRLGFDYEPPGGGSREEPPGRLEGEGDLEFAERLGFGYGAALPVTASDLPDLVVVDSPQSQAYVEALLGDDGASGCQQQGLSQMTQTTVFVVRDQLAEATKRTQADPRAVELVRAYSRCLANDGLDFEDSSALFGSLVRELGQLQSRILEATASIPEGGSLPEALWAEIEEYRSREQAAAVTHVRCDAQIRPDYDVVFGDVLAEVLAASE